MIQIPFNLVVTLLIIFVGLTVFILIYLMIRRGLDKRQEQKREKFLNTTEELWYRYIFEDGPIEPKMIPKDQTGYQFTESLFIEFINLFADERIRHNISFFANKYLHDYYRKMLRSRKWTDRMQALLSINYFRIDSLYHLCFLMKDRFKSYEEQYELLQMMSYLDEDAFLNTFKEVAPHLYTYDTKNLLLALNDQIYERLKGSFEELAFDDQLSFIDTLGTRGGFEDIVFLEELLTNNEPEIRIRALKSINEIGAVYELDTYRPFVKSEIWQERMMVARVLQYFSLDETYFELEKLMQDPHFIVRYEASETVRKGRDGEKRLMSFIAQSSDEYAIDAANEVLSKWAGGKIV